LFDRDKSTSAKSFASVVEKTAAIATVFPVFFFLIAAFVALTAMTRLVDDQRGQIGTLKALGYSDGAIMMKYIFFAAVATVLGSAIGLAAGGTLFPRIVWNAYSIMFDLPPLATPFDIPRSLLAFAAISVCTVGATFIACKKVVSEEPSRLFLPKAPAPGKRVLLERVGFIWKHIGFLRKVTIRNLLRYKKRFILTVLGVAGCTALLLTGFGLRDSISVIADRQFKSVYKYNLTVGLAERSDGYESSFAKAANILAENDVYSFIRTGSMNADVVKDGRAAASVSLTVAENYGDLHYFVTLRNRKSGETIAMDENSVVICEKLAETMGIGVGDAVRIRDESGREYELTVTGVTEHYVSNVIYTTREKCDEIMGKSPALSAVIVIAKGEEELRSDLAARLLESGYITSAVYFDEIADGLKESMKSINSVVVVLIVSAALLSFVVLYNLIDINITERKREIATLKVLGYRGSETFFYISREIMTLAVIGTALGILLGVLLHAFVVRTAEVDAVMFARTINNSSYALAALCSLVFAFLVNLVMYPKIKKIDTVLSLKAGE
ncbi:MAG: FtsX-like permease family protein, partial [Clostridia bacterium]|nr:FtsX-like permease family protein [Clostridia bacterium]